jgi:uncharacterized membrane protein
MSNKPPAQEPALSASLPPEFPIDPPKLPTEPPDARGTHRLQLTAVAALVVGYAVLSHYSSSEPDTKGLGAALSIGPVALIGTILVWRWTRPVIGLLTAVVLGALLYRHWAFFENNYEWADLVEQCGAYALVALSFGRTLFAGRVPLCTQLASELHGELAPVEIAYTRRATVVWAAFYVLLAAAIVILFFGLSQRRWSLFVNFATFGLIAIACVVDYAIRRCVLPRRAVGGILGMLRRSLIG